MKYEKPELMAATLAIKAIQNTKLDSGGEPPTPTKDSSAAYEDWEE